MPPIPTELVSVETGFCTTNIQTRKPSCRGPLTTETSSVGLIDFGDSFLKEPCHDFFVRLIARRVPAIWFHAH